MFRLANVASRGQTSGSSNGREDKPNIVVYGVDARCNIFHHKHIQFILYYDHVSLRASLHLPRTFLLLLLLPVMGCLITCWIRDLKFLNSFHEYGELSRGNVQISLYHLCWSVKLSKPVADDSKSISSERGVQTQPELKPPVLSSCLPFPLGYHQHHFRLAHEEIAC